MKFALLLIACFIGSVCSQSQSGVAEEGASNDGMGKVDDVKQTGSQIPNCGLSSDYHEYMRECAADYMKYMGLGVQAGQPSGEQAQSAQSSQAGSGSQNGGQGGDQGNYTQYMQQYAADYTKYTKQGGQSGGQSGGQDQNAQGGQGGQSGGQYMQQYAADYMKYMGQGGQSGGQGQNAQGGQGGQSGGGQSGGQDWSKYLKGGASGDSNAPMAKGFAKYMESTSKYAAPYQKYMSAGDQGGSGNMSSGNVPQFASQYVDKSAQAYISRPGSANQSNQSVAGQSGQASQGAAQTADADHASEQLVRDCRSMEDLKQWRDVLLAQIRTRVPEALRTCPEEKVSRDFVEGRAQLLASARAHLAMAEAEAGAELEVASPPKHEAPSAKEDSSNSSDSEAVGSRPTEPPDHLDLAADPPTKQALGDGAALSSRSDLQALLALSASLGVAGFGVALAAVRRRRAEGDMSIGLLQP